MPDPRDAEDSPYSDEEPSGLAVADSMPVPWALDDDDRAHTLPPRLVFYDG